MQVLTAADIDLPPYGPVPLPGLNMQMGRPVIASDVVRFVARSSPLSSVTTARPEPTRPSS